MIRFYVLLFSLALVKGFGQIKEQYYTANSSTETYLFNDERLGINAMERLLSKIEGLSKVKQSADREINEWRTKNRILDSLVTSKEAEIDRLKDNLETAASDKAKLSKRIAELEGQLTTANQNFLKLQSKFNRAMIENARIQDSLKQVISLRELEISYRDGLLFKMAEEDFRNGARLVLMKANKRGQLSPIDPANPTKADKADIDAIVLYYDFSVSKTLQFPLASKIEVKIPSLNYYKVFNAKSLPNTDFNQYKGKVVIATGNNALNIYKMGTIYLNVKIFDGDQTIETKPNSLKIYVLK